VYVAGLVAIAGIALAGPVVAQNTGQVEVGGFGQYTRADFAWHVQSGYGLGGHAGVFLTRRIALEGDASFSTFQTNSPRPPGNIQQATYAGRLMFNIPLTRSNHFMFGAGAGGQTFGGHTDFSFTPDVGFRFVWWDHVALRFDGLVEYVENPTAITFGYPPSTGVNISAARSTNTEIRGGLSFLLGKAPPPAPPPAPVVAQTPPESRPVPQAQPTAPPAEPNRDSLEAVNRAREALLAKVYFEFDRSELGAEQRATLDAKIPVLKANPNVRIRVEGNADERGSDEYNLALGNRRAEVSRKYLIDHGIDGARIDISSAGEERPVCQEHAESCWKQNRRDEFVIVVGGDRLVAPR
jgi:peptidoglycan-associated lipoprotein